jgi:hypothetical protein
MRFGERQPVAAVEPERRRQLDVFLGRFTSFDAGEPRAVSLGPGVELHSSPFMAGLR